MKRSLLFVCLLLSTTALMAARTGEALLLDSVITEGYNYKLKVVYTVDGAGNQKEISLYQWEFAGGEWVGMTKSAFTYNALNLETSETVFGWNTARTWQNQRYYERTYTNKGQLAQTSSFEWNARTNRWVNRSKNVRTYNGDGRQIGQTDYSWITGVDQWVMNAQRTTTYDEQERVAEETVSYWDVYEGLEETRNKTVYTYDDALNVITTLNWNQDSNKWIPDQKCEEQYEGNHLRTANRIFRWGSNTNQWILRGQNSYTYDRDGHCISEETTYFFLDGSFLNGNKIEREFDEQGLMTRSLSYIKSTETGEWEYGFDHQYGYDAFGNKTSDLCFQWDWIDTTWRSYLKTLMAYDVEHASTNCKRTLYEEYRWDYEGETWFSTPDMVERSYYSPFSFAPLPERDNKLVVYMNPADNIMYIDDVRVDPLHEQPVKVYNTSGTLLISGPYRIIDLSSLPGGVYLVTYDGKSCRVLKR